MNKENKLPTAYDMLKNQLFPSEQARSTIAGKIEEHTRLYTEPLREELEKLRAWKESAMKTLGVVDLQVCGKLLNIGLGQSIADKIVPGIKELRAENERLKKDANWMRNEMYKTELVAEKAIQEAVSAEDENEKIRDIYIYDVESIKSQNQKLREALEYLLKVHKRGFIMSTDWDKAKEALKGVSNE